jgi:hypothetical protein
VGPSVSNVGPSVRNVGPSVRNVGPSVRNVGPSVRNVGPSVRNSKPMPLSQKWTIRENQPLLHHGTTWVNERSRINNHPRLQILPNRERNAIIRAGGVHSSLNTISKVPGGANELIRNIRNSNVSKSPQAVAAIRKLGGPLNTVYVLIGLNTISGKQKKRIIHSKIRIAELNKVIKAVLKKKLISLVAHNVKKNHNLHPKIKHKKMYYQKSIKSLILKTKFANIVRRAAKK